MVMIGKVRRMHPREKRSVREIARATSLLSRNTVRKWLKRPLNGDPPYRRRSQPGMLTAFLEVLKRALEADAHRPHPANGEWVHARVFPSPGARS
jgi:hypothetical protein